MPDSKEALRLLLLNKGTDDVAEALSICRGEDVEVVLGKALRLGLDQLRQETVVSVIQEATAENPQLLAMAQLFNKSRSRLREKQGPKPRRSNAR